MKFVGIMCGVVCVLFVIEVHMFGMEQKQQFFSAPCINGNAHNKKVSVSQQLLTLIEGKMPYAFELMDVYLAHYEVNKFPELIQQGICTALSHQTGFDEDLHAISSRVARVDWSFMHTTTFESYLKLLIYKLFGDFIKARFVELDKLYEWIMKDIQYQVKLVEKSGRFVPIGSIVQPSYGVLPTQCISASSSISSSSKVGTLNPFAYLTENLLPDEDNRSENKESKA